MKLSSSNRYSIFIETIELLPKFFYTLPKVLILEVTFILSSKLQGMSNSIQIYGALFCCTLIVVVAVYDPHRS